MSTDAAPTIASLPLSPARAASLTERAYAQLRRAIADLVLSPGQPLTEAGLAEWLELGRTPVREALMRLRDEGLVEVVPHRGYFVSRISMEETREIYEILEGLESMAAKLAAQHATPDDLNRLEAAVLRQEQALTADDLDAWVAADEEFHHAILEACRNRRIRRLLDPLNARLHRLRVLTIRLRPKPTCSTEEHRAVLDAIRNGDGELAFRLHQAHRSAAYPVIMDAIRHAAGPNGQL